MSELNDDLLNYELGDDIDDHALYGADEDELLLSDDELEKDVTKEEKQQLKAEAEQWVQSQIVEQKKEQLETNGVESVSISQETVDIAVVSVIIPLADPNEVSSTAATTSAANPPIVQSEAVDGVSTSVEESQKLQSEFKEPPTGSLATTQQLAPASSQALAVSPATNASNTDEVTSSSSKELEMDHSSVISCSTSLATDSSFLQSSQESTGVGVGPGAGDFSDPREDFEEEREERTNIKITNERDTEPLVGNEHSPEKQNPRYMQGKRGGAGTALLMRPHGMRGMPYHQRPLLRFPPHGQFPPQQPLNLYAQHTQHAPPGPPGSGPGPGQLINPNTQNPAMHPHDPMNPNQPPRQRPPFSGYRSGAPMGGFRHPNPANMYQQLPPDYGNGPPFGPNFGHPSRAMFRPELSPMMQGGPGMPPGGMRPGMRAQRPPLQSLMQHNMAPNFVGGPPLRPQQPPPSQQQAPLPPSNSAGAAQPAGQSQIPAGLAPVTAMQRPGKVLINPNFKGGVEAAKNKFIKETQFMSSIRGHVSHLQSDDELLRQQEEFINKNRQHIEKRRQERSSPPAASRRSRTRSRTRSHSRERSYSPPKRAGGALSPRERHFERERERDRGAAHERFPERERERERERAGGDRPGRAGSRERERERGAGGIGVGNRGNRFRRAGSRDRDHENRGNYGKRRRSMSPNRSGPGGGNSSGRRGGGDRERNDVEEDEETRVYRLEIEKQKTLREKILRDKEMKRRRAAEEKLHEEKRAVQTGGNSGAANTTDEPQQPQQPQKLKPLIVTERKIISLKKRQQQQRREGDDNSERHQPTQRKQIPTAKILPEAKRTLTDHLANVTIGAGSGHVNTAVIKPVQKKETNTPTPPPKRELRRLSTPSDDEVELDYDEDELMLEDEERLLATPTPSPKRLPASRTPTPEPPKQVPAKQSKSSAATARSSSALQAKAFTSSNRRVVLKSSSSSSSTATGGGRREFSTATAELSETGRSRRGGSRHRDSNHSTGNGSGSSKGIFERLDARKQQQLQARNEGRRKGQQRIVLKHHD